MRIYRENLAFKNLGKPFNEKIGSGGLALLGLAIERKVHGLLRAIGYSHDRPRKLGLCCLKHKERLIVESNPSGLCN